MSGVNTSPRRTEGATLFVVVLVVLLLLSAVMVVTAQMTLASRRSVSDQENTLRAQYAADSTVARAQARISIINNLFKLGTYNGVPTGIQVPPGTNSDTIATYIANLCGISPTAMPLANQTAPICGSTAVGSNVLSGSADLNTRLSLFTATIGGINIINDTALAAVGGPAVGSTSADKQAFWVSMFGGARAMNVGTSINGMSTEGKVGAVVSSVWRMTGDEYEVHIRVPDVNVRATGAPASRSIKVGPQNQEYVLTLGRAPLAKYALFTNHHFADSTSEAGCVNSPTSCSRITFTSNTKFSGPVHTNEQFNFQGNPIFNGPVTSAGCEAGSIYSDGSECSSKVPGAYFYSSDFQPGSTTPSVLLNADSTANAYPNYNTSLGSSNPQFNATPTPTAPAIKWDANFLQLPENGNDQSGAASSGGLSISGAVSNMSLSVANITAAGATQKTQRISYTTASGTVNLAINANKQVFILSGTTWLPAVSNGNGGWSAGAASATPGMFNGVVYVSGNIANLNGPARSPSTATTATSTNTSPAVADFMKLNVTAAGDVGITSDLRYENPPCDDNGNCNNENAQNIFGIYSSTGDVKIVNRYYCSGTATSCSSYNTRNTGFAPPNVSIQAVLMAGQGKVTVDGYGAGPARSTDRGSVNLVGGIIENYYGAFGLTSGRGYGRNFVYDTRTAKGVLPPAFPTTRNWNSNFTTAIKFSTGTQVQQSNSDYKSNVGTN